MKPQIALNKLSLGELFAQGFSFFKQHFIPLSIITIAIYLPLNLILEYAWAWLNQLEPLHFGSHSLRIYLRLNQILENLIGVICILAYVHYIEESLWHRSVDAVSALKHGLNRWGHGVGTSILAGVILLGLFLLLIVPGIIWAIYYSFMIYIVAVRNTGGKEALAYSKNLVQGRWWEVLGFSLTFNLLAIGTVLLFGMVFHTFLPAEVIWLDVLSGVIGALIYAPFTVMQILYFLNLDYLLMGVNDQGQPPTPGSEYDYLAKLQNPNSEPTPDQNSQNIYKID